MVMLSPLNGIFTLKKKKKGGKMLYWLDCKQISALLPTGCVQNLVKHRRASLLFAPILQLLLRDTTGSTKYDSSAWMWSIGSSPQRNSKWSLFSLFTRFTNNWRNGPSRRLVLMKGVKDGGCLMRIHILQQGFCFEPGNYAWVCTFSVESQSEVSE